MEPGSTEPSSLDVTRSQALWAQSQVLRAQSRALLPLSEQASARVHATREQILAGRSQREIFHHSRFARLVAKQETMPVIEQAKGIIMARQRCGPEKAFDLLRQLSQRTNVKVHVLAARIVEQIAASNDGDDVIPISLDARRHQRPRSRARPAPGDSDHTLPPSAQAPRSLRGHAGSIAGQDGSPFVTPGGCH